GLIDAGSLLFQPRQKRRTEVETDPCVVVEELENAILRVKNSGSGIRSIALGRDALIPVMVRVGSVLKLDGFKIWILSRGLIEMPMDANVFHIPSVRGRSMSRNEWAESRRSLVEGRAISGARSCSGPHH